MSFIRKQLHNFLGVSHSQICHMAFKQSDCELEKLKKKTGFSKSLTVFCCTHFIQRSVILHYLCREAHSVWCSDASTDNYAVVTKEEYSEYFLILTTALRKK